MNQQIIEVKALSDLDKAAAILLQILNQTNNTVVCLNGEMGVGKTSFVKAILKALGAKDQGDSPTFSIVNDYKVDGKTIHHFDLYRLQTLEEVEEIGFWEYIDSGNLCIIEWPNLITELLLPEQKVTVQINLTLQECREFTFSS